MGDRLGADQQGEGSRGHLLLRPRAGYAWLHRQTDPHDPHPVHPQRRRVRGLRATRRRADRRRGPGPRSGLRPAREEPLPVLRVQPRRGGGRSPDGDRARQASLDVRRAAQPAPGHSKWMLADAEVELRACRWLIWEGAWKADRGEDARVEASIAKLYSSEVLGRVVDAAVQIHGGYGVSKEFPLERWYREARVRRIGEGPSEVHRMVIARQLFR